MGDRANIVVKKGTCDQHEQVCLYTHCNGSELKSTLQAALIRGKDRWHDFQYLTRIIFCEMIKDDWQSTTGFGITQNIWGGCDNVIYVDVCKQEVTLPSGDRYDFNDFNDFIL